MLLRNAIPLFSRALRRIALLLLLLPGLASAQAQVDLELDTGSSMTIKRFDADADERPTEPTLLIWLPSSRGLGSGYVPLALDMASYGIDTWVLDLHTTYMEPTGRSSFANFELEDMLALKRYALAQGYRRLFVLAVERGARYALEAGRLWQQSVHNGELQLAYLFMAPHLVEESFAMGERAEYLRIARSSNLPIYLIQPEFSTKYARRREIVDALQTGGAAVFMQTIAGVQGGYHMRPDEDLSERDLQARAELPGLLRRAMGLLASLPQPERAAALAAGTGAGKGPAQRREPRLHPYAGDPLPAPLRLPRLPGGENDDGSGEQYGDEIDLRDLRGQVVLVNFWASWCGPCLEEIPSMYRLVERLRGEDFHILAVNIGEPPERIRGWTRDIPVNFPVLLDADGAAVRDWRVYAYPSNFLIDREGRIRYSYRGALDWDAAPIVATIESLL